MRKGELVSVKPGPETGQFYKLNCALVRDHGYLWIVLGQHARGTPQARSELYDCRSIATGEQSTWFTNEMTRAKEERLT